MAEDARRSAALFAERLARSCADALGNEVVAIILHGSLTLGDFMPGRSDIDLLIVVRSSLTDKQIEAVRDAVAELRDEAPTRVDLRIVTRAVASAPAQQPAMEASLGLRPGQPPQIETRVASEPDLVVEFSIVRAHGRSIVGAEPSAVIGAVPTEWVVEIGDRQLAAWERLADDEAHAELMVLTSCQIWRLSVDGVHSSKSEAGRWALARDSSLTAVDEALRRRVGHADVVGAEGIRRLIAAVRREIARN